MSDYPMLISNKLHSFRNFVTTNNIAAALTDSQLGGLAESLAGAQYSQKQESEADDFGYEFLKAHGKNPWGMVSAFEKMESLSGGAAKSSYINKMFSSHPETAKRIKRLSDRAKKDGIERPAKTNADTAK